MKKPIAIYTICNTIALAIYEICPGGDEVMAAFITDDQTARYTSRPYTVWYDSDADRLYIEDSEVRYYLDEFMRV